MSTLTDQIVKVLRQHRCIWSMDGNTLSKCLCGWSGDVDHTMHVAERVAETFHLERMLIKEGEIPPLYAIEGWMRGSTEQSMP